MSNPVALIDDFLTRKNIVHSVQEPKIGVAWCISFYNYVIRWIPTVDDPRGIFEFFKVEDLFNQYNHEHYLTTNGVIKKIKEITGVQ